MKHTIWMKLQKLNLKSRQLRTAEHKKYPFWHVTDEKAQTRKAKSRENFPEL